MNASAAPEPEVTVTVPLYNEAENIPTLYERVRTALENLGRRWELILVNDGSRDGSAALLSERKGIFFNRRSDAILIPAGVREPVELRG